MANHCKGNYFDRKRKGPTGRRTIMGMLAGTMALLMLLPVFGMIVQNVGAVTQSEIDALKEEQAASQAKQEELKAQLAEVKEDQTAAQEQRYILTQQLEAINDEIENIDAQIAWYDGEIAQKEEERKEAEAREAEQYELFCQRVRAMEEQGTVSYWSILFNAKSFSELMDRIADVDAVMARDNQIMEELIATREELERLQADLETARAEEQEARDQQAAKQAEQQAKVAEAQDLLDQINADVDEVNRQLDAEDEAAAEIQAEIEQKQAALAEQIRQEELKRQEEERKRQEELEQQQQQAQQTQQPQTTQEPQQTTQQPDTSTPSVTSSGYSWPLPSGCRTLTSAFGYRIHPITGVAQSHTGIDVSATGGTTITAAKAGVVITSAYHWSYGNYVVISHGNGDSTLYAHMSRRAVSEGETVAQGQTIGYVGSTGSSTGNHLHLEIREGGQRVDPEKCFPELYNSFIRAYNW